MPIGDYAMATIPSVENYTKKSQERAIATSSNSNVNLRTNRKATKSRKQKWEEKQLDTSSDKLR